MRKIFTLLLMCLALSTISGGLYASTSLDYLTTVTVSISKSNVPLKAIFSEIEKQTDLVFVYNNTNVNDTRITSVNVTNKPVNEVLGTVLSGTKFSYDVSEKYIIIKESSKPASNQQRKPISGVVKDATGAPIIGATVIVKGTTIGAVTDEKGQYFFEAPENAIIEVAFIGYKKIEAPVGSKSTIDIIMQEDALLTEEVVVVGYGTQRKVNVIGSIASIDSKQLENRATTSVTQSLTGQLPGVTVTTAGGRPGVNPGTIRVRGVGSFGATPDALVLVDGIPGDMNTLNSDDILSVSVLKDASTSAIYGARAANGVVLITTKTGKSEKVTISYNGYAGFNKATALPEFVNSWEYAEMLNVADGVTRFTDTEIQAMKDGSQPDLWANENYMKDVFSRNGFQTGHDFAITGGNEKTQYYVSMGMISQDGIIAKNNYLRYNGRVNLTTQIAPKVKMTVRVQGVSARVKEPNTAGTIDGEGMNMIIQQGAIRFPGIRPNRLTSGNWGPGVKGFGSPKSWIESPSFHENPTFRLNSNVKFDYTPIKGLTISAMGGYNFLNNVDRFYKATLPVEVNGKINTLGPSALKHNTANTEYKTFQGTVNYNKDFDSGHSFDVLVGYSWEDQSQREVKSSRDNFPGNDLPYLDAGSPENQKASGGGYDWALQSVFGRAQYNYKERYLAEVTMRYDGSSRFPNNEKYGFFPSAAIGWRLSEESFMKNNERLGFINNLKLKASYGILGNNNIGDYPYQSVYTLGKNYSFGGTVAQGAQMTTYNDPRLRWETTRTIDGGIEASLWRGLLSFNATYFHRNTYDVLYKANASISAIYGLAPSETNTGEVTNKGWEFEIGHRNTVGNFSYGVNGNFSIIQNNVESLGIGNVNQPNGLVGNGSNLFIGLPMQMYYGYQTDGVFLDQKDIDDYFAHTDQSAMGSNKAKTKPGDIRYKDISGPDGKPDGKVDATYDRSYLGSQIPKFTFGLSLNAAFKGFDANVLFQGVGGVSGLLEGYAGWALWSEGNIQRWQADGAFDPKNPVRNPSYPRISNLGNATGVNTQTSDFWVRNSSYLRLKNLQIGYTIPTRITKKAKISQLRIYASMENVVTWSKYPDGWDPETSTGGDFYPFLSTYVFGLNLKF